MIEGLIFKFSPILYSTETVNVFTIYATTNVAGEIEPCGWKKKPLGGLARKSAVLNSAKNKKSDIFVLDAGYLFFKKNTVNPGVEVDHAKINAETIVNAFNKIGCDAFNVGQKDFALGLDYLIYLKKSSNFPFVSANIKNSTGSYLFTPYKIMYSGGIRLGVIGLSSVFALKGINVEDPIESIKMILDFVNYQSDFVVLLFNANDKDMKRLHSENLDIGDGLDPNAEYIKFEKSVPVPINDDLMNS